MYHTKKIFDKNVSCSLIFSLFKLLIAFLTSCFDTIWQCEISLSSTWGRELHSMDTLLLIDVCNLLSLLSEVLKLNKVLDYCLK